MATDFDPNIELPPDLVNAKFTVPLDDGIQVINPGLSLEEQMELLDGDDFYDGDEISEEIMDAPGSFVILEQIVRVGSDGSQVVDVIVDVEEIEGAISYDIRMSTR